MADEEEGSQVEVEIRGESVTPLRLENGKTNGNGTRTVHIRINAIALDKLDTLKALLEANSGLSPVCFWIFDDSSRRKVVTPFKVEASTRFVGEVERLLGKDVVRVA